MYLLNINGNKGSNTYQYLKRWQTIIIRPKNEKMILILQTWVDMLNVLSHFMHVCLRNEVDEKCLSTKYKTNTVRKIYKKRPNTKTLIQCHYDCIELIYMLELSDVLLWYPFHRNI